MMAFDKYIGEKVTINQHGVIGGEFPNLHDFIYYFYDVYTVENENTDHVDYVYICKRCGGECATRDRNDGICYCGGLELMGEIYALYAALLGRHDRLKKSDELINKALCIVWDAQKDESLPTNDLVTRLNKLMLMPPVKRTISIV